MNTLVANNINSVSNVINKLTSLDLHSGWLWTEVPDGRQAQDIKRKKGESDWC